MDTLVIDLNGGAGAPVKREDRDDQSPRVVERQYRNVAGRFASIANASGRRLHAASPPARVAAAVPR